MSNIIEVRNLVVDYGYIRAIKGINMNVQEGSIVAILGANGAGKTTTIRTISGVVKASAGEVLYKGENIVNRHPYKIAGLGLYQSPEGRMILNGLTVEENLLVGAYSLKPEVRDGKTISVKDLRKELLDKVYNYFPILKERHRQEAMTLSGGEQQMLAIGRALMGNPTVLLLDEPSLGLAPLIVQEIFKIIAEIKRDGKTILIVEQNALQTLKIADYAYVLEVGKISKQGTGEQLLNDKELVNAYLGI
ncbi:MAG TPA: ABC transporter ATP-binding protein [Erysipelothrix sp.]|jgi:branched-chain amino acid transport system ATP-binding protein|nr:ABC transporter ATP-binding protein [Erysipelothrix sp.]